MSRSKSPIYREPCGCTHDGSAWLKFCAPCEADYVARHEMAHAEHLARAKPGTYVYETVTHITDPPKEPA